MTIRFFLAATAAVALALADSLTPARAGLFGRDKNDGPGATYLEQLETGGPSDDDKAGDEVLRAAIRDASRALAAFSGKDMLTEPGLQRYGQSIVDKLVATYAGPPPDPAIRVELTADRGGGASASFDNVVYVSAELFSLAENEDEIAFIIGHEVAHILSRDFKDDGFLETKKNVADAAARAAIAGASLANTDFQANPDGQISASTDDAAVSKAARTAAIGFFVVAEISDTLIAPSWTNKQEDRADLVATDLLMRAGYNPTAVGPFLRRTSEIKQTFAARFEQLTQSRVERTRSQLGNLVNIDGYNLNFDTEGAQKMFKTMGKELLYAGAFSIRDARRASTHDSAEEREEAITEYLVQHYAAQLGELKLTNVSQKSVADSLKKRLDSARMIRDALLVDDLATAVDNSQGVLSGSTSNNSFFRYTMYLLRHAQYMEDRSSASRGKAVLNLERSLDSPTATPQIFTALVIERLNDKRFQDAFALLDKAKARFDNETAFWPVEIMSLARSRRMAEAEALLEKCGAQGGRRLRALCKTALESANDLELRRTASQDEAIESEADLEDKGNDFSPGNAFNRLFGNN